MKKLSLFLGATLLGLSPAVALSLLNGKEAQGNISTLDMAKVRYTVGQGTIRYALVLSFGNSNRLDNLVVGVASDKSDLSAKEALELIAADDKRIKLETGSGDAIKSLWFDLDGNDVFDIRDTGADDGWKVGETLLASDGSTKVFTICCAQADPAQAPYYFYLPKWDEKGVWVPETMTVRLSDDSFVLPVLVQPQGASITNITNWQASQKTESYLLDRSIIMTPYTFVDGSYHARPTLTGATGTTYVRYRPMISSVYTESNYMALTVEAPTVPMTKIILKDTVVEAGLNKYIPLEYTYLPANATFTGVTATVADATIASYSSTTGLKTKEKEGSTIVTVASPYDAKVKADMKLNVALRKPIQDVHFGHGSENGVINVNVRQLIGLKPVVVPADADIPDVTVTLSDNGTSKEDMTCSVYKVNWWDKDNVRSQFYELSGHRPTGDHPAKVHVESKDGRFVKDFVVNVIESDRTPLAGGYENGTIILNEEWFGHTNGGLNYLTENNEVIYQAYEKENPGMAFGCTSQYGTIWNGKLFVISKQPADGGDIMPGGGCLVIADAKTLKRIGGSYNRPSFDGKTGDGRAVAGATSDKIYVTTSNGIFIYDIQDLENPVITGRIAVGKDDNGADLYNGQIGDIINGGRYVYAVMQNTGLFYIDPLTDKASIIEDPKIQGVTQTADGTVWYATIEGTGAEAHSVFVALNPDTATEVRRVALPSSIGTVACSWGAWRSTAFKGDYATGDIWFVTGAAGIAGGASGDYYRFSPDADPKNIKPFFTLNGVTGINDFGEEVGQMTYGTPVYDPRNEQLVVMTGRSGAASGGYRDHWIHLVDGNSGQIKKTIKLNAYYWFQSLPILPDKYPAEFKLENISMNVNDSVRKFDLADVVADKDNIKANIKVQLLEDKANPADAGKEERAAAVSIENNILSVVPVKEGSASFTLQAQSNGQISSHTFTVTVTPNVGLSDVMADASSFRCEGSRLYITGLQGSELAVYSLAGEKLTRFTVDEENYIFDFGSHSGVFVISNGHGISQKVIIR